MVFARRVLLTPFLVDLGLQVFVFQVTDHAGRELGKAELRPGPFQGCLALLLEAPFDHEVHGLVHGQVLQGVNVVIVVYKRT